MRDNIEGLDQADVEGLDHYWRHRTYLGDFARQRQKKVADYPTWNSADVRRLLAPEITPVVWNRCCGAGRAAHYFRNTTNGRTSAMGKQACCDRAINRPSPTNQRNDACCGREHYYSG